MTTESNQNIDIEVAIENYHTTGECVYCLGDKYITEELPSGNAVRKACPVCSNEAQSQEEDNLEQI